jgi:pimeloyl-ACP methyl ester carboxylesterase
MDKIESKNKSSDRKPPVILVPGGVMPAALSYGMLLGVVNAKIQAVPKELEVYKSATPPAGYKLDMEVEGIRQTADSNGFTRFHLVGYSAGGASSLAFVAQYPERVMSLVLVEPAWAGNEGLTAEDVADWAEMDRLMSLPPDQRMSAFARWQMRPGIEPPRLPLPPDPPPAWMAQRLGGLLAIAGAFKSYSLDRERWRSFQDPVYFSLGSLSTRFYERMAKMLKRYFTNFRLEVYEGRSHYDPPHRAEAERFARAAGRLWGIEGE